MAEDAPPLETDLTAEDYLHRAADRLDHYDYPRAIRLLTTALHLDPYHADAYFRRGNAYRFDGHLRAALDDYGRAIALDASFAEAYYCRARLKKEQLDLEGAIADYEMYLKVCSGVCDEDRMEIEQTVRDLRAQLRGSS